MIVLWHLFKYYTLIILSKLVCDKFAFNSSHSIAKCNHSFILKFAILIFNVKYYISSMWCTNKTQRDTCANLRATTDLTPAHQCNTTALHFSTRSTISHSQLANLHQRATAKTRKSFALKLIRQWITALILW